MGRIAAFVCDLKSSFENRTFCISLVYIFVYACIVSLLFYYNSYIIVVFVM